MVPIGRGQAENATVYGAAVVEIGVIGRDPGVVGSEKAAEADSSRLVVEHDLEVTSGVFALQNVYFFTRWR